MNKDVETTHDTKRIPDQDPIDLEPFEFGNESPDSGYHSAATADLEANDEDFPQYQKPSPSRRTSGLFCFNCNRDERHVLADHRRWFYSYLVGMTFGLIKIVGPFRCQCCGARRLMSSDKTNLRFWWRNLSNERRSKPKRRSSR
jgi:hypothetical protein